MKRLLLNNYRIKVVAVIIATMLWWFVYSEHHPQYRAVITVPITYENVPKFMRLEDRQELIRLKLRGEPDNLKEAQDKTENKIRATLDLAELGPGRHNVSVQIENDTSAIVINRNTSINIVLKRLNKLEMGVGIRFHGTLPLGLRQGQVVVPEKASVYGVQDELDAVEQVMASVQLTDHYESFTELVELKAVDSSGMEVENVNIDPGRISVKVPVEKESEIVVPVVLMQKPGSRIDAEKISFTPVSVTLYGNESALKRIDSVGTEEFDVSRCEEGGFFSLRIQYPQNVLPSEERVTVSCEPPKEISREFDVNVRVINLCEKCTCKGCESMEIRSVKETVLKTVVKVVASGPNSQVNSIIFSDITAVVDLLGLDPGEHKVKLHPGLATDVEDVELVADPVDVVVTIGRKGD